MDSTSILGSNWPAIDLERAVANGEQLDARSEQLSSEPSNFGDTRRTKMASEPSCVWK